MGNENVADIYGICEGDCDSDLECMGDLVCFERTGFTNVPGCQGEGRFSSDYCYQVTDEPTPSVRLIYVIYVFIVCMLVCVRCQLSLFGERLSLLLAVVLFL